MIAERIEYLSHIDPSYIEELYARYQQDPYTVDASWRYFFDGLELGEAEAREAAQRAAAQAPLIGGTQSTTPTIPASHAALDLSAEAKVADLINAYRSKGHLLANINPLEAPITSHPLLALQQFGLTDNDLDRNFTAGNLIGIGKCTLREILAHLQTTYCRTIGVQFTHISDPVSRDWLQSRMESTRNVPQLSPEARKALLARLTESESFEKFLHTRFVAQKRFSIEGGESLITALDEVIHHGSELGASEFVVGMAHRGRLNVLRNIFQKPAEYILSEFDDNFNRDESMGEGDVKYHKGYSQDIITRSNQKAHLSLTFNPSHLEFVNPVVEGISRGKQRRLDDKDRTRVIPVLVHGDAAFAGQGVVYETLNLSQVPGYWTGGTIHFIVNNQVGFTTDPQEARSTPYSTDLAKMLETPIFHVNGDDPEAVAFVSRLAMEYRQQFKKDVFVDIVCYRRYGHNEGDEPSFTQPLMYAKIKKHTTTRALYAQTLIAEGVITEVESNALADQVTDSLQKALDLVRQENPVPRISAYQDAWKDLRQATDDDLFKPVETAVSTETLQDLATTIFSTPEGFHPHPKLARLIEGRKKAILENEPFDWGTAELLAYATLLKEGNSVRLSGQDCERGTFSHRHSVLSDIQNGKKITPLNLIDNAKGEFIVHNSTLSETAVLGFEYGWSLADPRALVIWEAQFGDFMNGAQVIIDQFISSSETKWQRASGLVMLLPHGYEGMGPEHSSARLERWLQLCGKRNMTVCNFTTPAQVFHALRRQLKRPFRKPLVVMSPKSLLRAPRAVSTLQDLTQDRFHEVLDDSLLTSRDRVKRVVLCSGKVYYDLLQEREKLNRDDVALIRVEQLYPWPADQLAEILNSYPKDTSFYWAQEEPLNMGAWFFVFGHWMGGFESFQDHVGGRPIRYIGRERQAAPAIGSSKLHQKEQQRLVDQAFSD